MQIGVCCRRVLGPGMPLDPHSFDPDPQDYCQHGTGDVQINWEGNDADMNDEENS